MSLMKNILPGKAGIALSRERWGFQVNCQRMTQRKLPLSIENLLKYLYARKDTLYEDYIPG